MAALEAIYGVLGGLGGATIGAWSAGRLQRGAHKTTSATAAAEQKARALELALETTSTARIATRAWALFMELAIQDLAHNRPVQVAAFDTTVQTLLGDVTSALFRLAAIPDIPFAEAPARMDSPLTRATWTLREALVLYEVIGRPGQTDMLLALVRDGAADMNETFVRQTNLLTGRIPTPPEQAQQPRRLASHLSAPQPQSQPPDYLSRAQAYQPDLRPRRREAVPEHLRMSMPAPVPEPFETFWFAVPTPRQLYTLEGEASPPPGDQLLPGSWYLAVGRHPSGLVVAVADDLELVLQDTEGIQRG
ncbi:hypothetical protein J7F03_19585 [Streptomyces sp. ISL-43]|uniref:hypothetical protein n=1 Tax=Streptomyces sp. ISL-43 TaxID=2819183 RepID=UPI001BE8C982|nr:hypothetical protein [Streptomyces sp. ISL-43]MBT2449255.1 hypothetical protein [Streptomyces sp. ISL-43]